MQIVRPDSIAGVLWHTFDSYSRNFKFLLLFAIPFLIVFPLALLLPNFASFGGIFLRFGSISRDLGLFDLLLIAVAFCISLLLFSFGLVAINMLVKTERTLKTVSFYEFEKIEMYTFKLFAVFFFAFIISLAANIFLYEQGLHSTLGALVSLIASLLVVFAPQAIVMDNQSAKHVPKISLSIIFKKIPLFLTYLVIAVFLIGLVSQIFISLAPSIGNPGNAQLLAVAFNALLIVPFLEVLKAQIYLSKYTLL
ncbi:MAG: hypothetical protein V1644_03820 [Candidatus Micrarchaeota archaeon]